MQTFLAILLLTSLVSWRKAQSPTYTINNLGGNPGIYSEPLLDTKSIESEWKLVVHMDVDRLNYLAGYRKDFKFIESNWKIVVYFEIENLKFD